MSSDKPIPRATNPQRTIHWLGLGHIVIGMMSAAVAFFVPHSPTLWGASFVGLVSGQASLLGIVGSLGSDPWWRRLLGVMVGISYLGFLLGCGLHAQAEALAQVAVTTTFVAMPLLSVRLFRVAIRLDSSPAGAMGRIQFSIRHLMILTFVLACLLTIGRFVEPFAIRLIETPDGTVVLNRFDELVFQWFDLAVLGLLGVLPVGLVLATKQPVVFAAGYSSVGACAGYLLGRFYDVPVSLAMASTVTQVIVVVASLLVVRACGYRLVRLRHRVDAATTSANCSVNTTTESG